MSSGSGFLGGYGVIRRSAYATPLELGFKPWTPEFVTEDGTPAFPYNDQLNPYPPGAQEAEWVRWRTSDWDPGLRHWSLGLDPRLTEWLQDLDLAAPSAMAAREFASRHADWTHEGAGGSLDQQINSLLQARWLAAGDLAWWPHAAVTVPALGTDAGFTVPVVTTAGAWIEVKRELQTLIDYMNDSRARYMPEIRAQADGIPRHFMHLLAMDRASKPWTVHLIRCALAIGNVAYMHFKARFRRVRPSFLCPGLVPNFGPPRHPAFPSGHSFLGHFIALLLLEVPGIHRRYGVGMGISTAIPPGRPDGGDGTQATWAQVRSDDPLPGALLWLANRLAVNRERLGVHYPSDSSAGRHLAGGIWHALVGTPGNPADPATIQLPTLQLVLARAKAEWT